MSSVIEHQKLAERLFILNDHQLGVLSRLHHMKQILASPEYRPAVLPNGDKSFDSAWKILLKKFPSIEVKSGQASFQPFITHQKELFAMLSSYYYNFVEVLEVRHHVLDTLGRLAYAQIQFDIMVNLDLTRLYLDLISNYFAMMFFITRIPDTKAIIALFNFLYDQLHGKTEINFPRMAELFTESPENVLKAVHCDINPYAKSVVRALASLHEFFARRTVRAQNWSDGHFLNILNEPGKIAHTVLGDQLACELIPYEIMERWVIFGYLLIYKTLVDEDAFNRFKTALRQTYVVVLFRDEVVYIHALIQSFFESVWTNKMGAKRINEVKETLPISCSQTFEMHTDRRAYLRSALRQLHLILSDEPGLLGPKAFLVFWGLSYATDEVHWLLRHFANPPVKKLGGTGGRAGTQAVVDYRDAFLPELLFYMEELRSIVIRYTPVIQRFYIQLLGCYDAPGLAEHVNTVLSRLAPEEATMMSNITRQLSDLADRDLLQTANQNPDEAFGMFDFAGIRLDWLRLQASLSSESDCSINLADHRRLVEHFHSTVFHTKLVDYLDELLRLVSDLSIFSFYPVQFVDLFQQCLQVPAQLRFVIVFPSLCSHAVRSCHDICPEERPFLGRSAIRRAYHFCHKIADRICALLFIRIDEFGELGDQLAPQNAVPLLPDQKLPKRKNRKPLTGDRVLANGSQADLSRVRQPLSGVTDKTTSGKPDVTTQLPGSESFRRGREEQTDADRTLFALSQLCQSVNHVRELRVYDQLVYPREVLQKELQSRLIEVLSSYAEPTSIEDQLNEPLITKPSELLRRVRAVMDVLMDLEHHVCIDVVSVFTTVFTQHTQPRDGYKGELTMTAHYTTWYIESFLKHAYMDHFVYSPLLKSFVTLVSPDVVRFRAEDFADLNELRALAELIGSLGIKYLGDQLMQTVGDRIDEIKKLVLQNRTVLEHLRECFDDPLKTKQLASTLQNCDALLTLLKEIGIALAFRKLCLEALHDILQQRIPFLLSTVRNLRSYITHQSGGQLLPPASPSVGTTPDPSNREEMEMVYARFNSQLVLNNLSSSMGISADLDYSLCAILNSRRHAMLALANQPNAAGVNADLDYHIACLFVVFVANALPRLVRQEHSSYLLNLEANENNCHCIPYSVNALMVAMFSLLRPGDLEARSKEFLALASSNLLRLGLETSTTILSSELCGSNSQPSSSASGTNASAVQTAKHRDSIYLLFDNLVHNSPCLSHSLEEACFPYSLIRSAYHNLAKSSGSPLSPGKQQPVSSQHGNQKLRE